MSEDEEYKRYASYMALPDYNQWAQSFESEINRIECHGSDFISYLVRIFIVDKNSRILDMGAGTGLCSQKLRKLGYENIDSLEPAEKMVELAKEKKLYLNYYVEKLTDKPTSIPENQYDVVISQGAFGLEGHIPAEGLREHIRVVKPNGMVFIIFRHEYLVLNKDYARNFDRILDEMKNDGQIEVLIKTRFPEYLKTKEGIILVIRKLK